jgi:hypothetical protein
VFLRDLASAESGAALQLFSRHVDEQAPRLVIADGSLDFARARRIGAERGLAASRGQLQQAFAHGRRNIGLDVIDEPAEAPHEGARTNPFEIISGLGPVEPAAGSGQYGGSLSHAAGERRAIDAVNGGLFAPSDLRGDSGNQPPVHTKASPVPADDGWVVTTMGELLPSRPDPASDYPEELIEEARARMSTLQRDELLTQSQILEKLGEVCWTSTRTLTGRLSLKYSRSPLH